MKRIVVWSLVLTFCLVSALAVAAGDKWAVIKDKNGVCKVIQVKDKTPKTIAGPFTTKAQAVAAKEKKCPSKAAASGKKKSSKAKADTKKAKVKAKADTKKAKAKDKKKAKSKDTKKKGGKGTK